MENPAGASPAHMLALQRTFGNRAVGEAIQRATSRVQTAERASARRPFKVIYHITKSDNRRNIAMFSNKEGEEEILFPKGSTLTTGQVVKRIDSGVEIEAEIR